MRGSSTQPKPLMIALQAIVLDTFGVQVHTPEFRKVVGAVWTYQAGHGFWVYTSTIIAIITIITFNPKP